MNDRFWELLAKYDADLLSPEEKAEFEQLLLDHPDDWLKTGLLRQISWKAAPMLSSEKKDAIIRKIIGGKDNDLEEYERKYQARRRKNRRMIAGGMAIAICLFTIGLFSVLHRPDIKDLSEWEQIVTADGMKTMLHLPDGSEVWLNAGSTLRYRKDNFNKNKRDVCLSGEAYFIIKHDADKPFVVHTDRMDIRVLGTQFDVKAYPGENYSEASLIKGSVEIEVKQHNQEQRILLKPDQKLIIRDDQVDSASVGIKERKLVPGLNGTDNQALNIVLQPIKPLSGHVIPETAWKDNVLAFEDESLESLALRLDRWYGVAITIEDTSLARQRFTGRADNVSLDKLLQILQMIKPFKYTIDDKQVIIQQK